MPCVRWRKVSELIYHNIENIVESENYYGSHRDQLPRRLNVALKENSPPYPIVGAGLQPHFQGTCNRAHPNRPIA